MNFETPVEISLSLLKEFVYLAKQQGFAATDTKTTLPDQTSVYSYRPFSKPQFAGMIYTDAYKGNTIESGQESITIDLIMRWGNQYFGGTKEPCWNLSRNPDYVEGLKEPLLEIGSAFPQVVSAFLKQSLMRLPSEFPVRGPHEFRDSKVEFEGKIFPGDWIYTNDWEAVPLFDTEDPFAAYHGEERISLNGVEIYWHAYHGGLVRDKYFPFVLQAE